MNIKDENMYIYPLFYCFYYSLIMYVHYLKNPPNSIFQNPVKNPVLDFGAGFCHLFQNLINSVRFQNPLDY